MSEDKMERILVIDDDPAIRKLMEKLLQKKGFVALSADTGAGGLELLRGHLAEISLIILDYTLLDMSCEDICREISGLAPEIPVVIMSGQDIKLINEKTAFCPAIKATLYKPFTIEELMNSIKISLK